MRAGKTRIDILPIDANFPSFSEGLSLRGHNERKEREYRRNFPSFSEGLSLRGVVFHVGAEPPAEDFPSFSEGLSLRGQNLQAVARRDSISLPFRRDFH